MTNIACDNSERIKNKEFRIMKREGGFIAITSVLIIGAIVVVLGVSIFHSALTSYSISTAYESGQKADFLADFCLKEGVLRLKENIDYGGGEELEINDEVCSILFAEDIDARTKKVSSLGRSGDQPHFSRSSQLVRYVIESSASDWEAGEVLEFENFEIINDSLRLKGEIEIIRTTTSTADWEAWKYAENVKVKDDALELDIGPEEWQCGNSITFTYKGEQVTYGTVEHNGECWMDRNLGADPNKDPADYTGYDDPDAYGDLFQWGRLDDGHQTRTSGTTGTCSNSDNPGHSNFITQSDFPYDWRCPQNDYLWQGVSGTNNPCPSGWRIPTMTELNTERASWSEDNYNGAFASPLKLTAGGGRFDSFASLGFVGSYGFYWSSSVIDTLARCLYFRSSVAYMFSGYRAYGFSVRCVQD